MVNSKYEFSLYLHIITSSVHMDRLIISSGLVSRAFYLTTTSNCCLSNLNNLISYSAVTVNELDVRTFLISRTNWKYLRHILNNINPIWDLGSGGCSQPTDLCGVCGGGWRDGSVGIIWNRGCRHDKCLAATGEATGALLSQLRSRSTSVNEMWLKTYNVKSKRLTNNCKFGDAWFWYQRLLFSFRQAKQKSKRI